MEKTGFFNLYIRVGVKKQIVEAANLNDIASIFEGIKNNNEFVWVDGRKVYLNYDVFKIYDVHKAFNKHEKSSLKDEIHKTGRILRSVGVPLLKDLGADVTDKFIIPLPKSVYNVENMNNKDSSKKGKLFISHSSKDKELVNKFIDLILILGLGLKRDSVFCTSVQGTDIKSGIDFKSSIKNELVNARAVIQIITKNYKSSEVCLNEMGAAWVVVDNIIPLVASPFNYDVGFIHASSQQLKLNSKKDLIKLYDDHKEAIFTEKINISNFQTQVNEFVAFIEEYGERQGANSEKVFFYNEISTINGILRQNIFSHPPSEETTPVSQLSFHRYYYIEPLNPIDVLSNELIIEEGNCNYSRINIDKIQLHLPEQINRLNLKDWVGKKIMVKGEFWGGHTAWHQTEVLITASEINPLTT